MRLTAINTSKGETLISEGRVANTMWTRLRGLIGAPPLEQGQGIWIDPCNGIHMMFMGFPIDVVYLDRDLNVVAVDEAMPPWRIGRLYRKARSVLELPAGTVASTGTAVGDQIALHERD